MAPTTRTPLDADAPCWREVMTSLLGHPLPVEGRLEALIDHVERAGRPASRR